MPKIDTATRRFWALAALGVFAAFILPGGALLWHVLGGDMPGWAAVPALVLVGAGAYGLAWTLEEFDAASGNLLTDLQARVMAYLAAYTLTLVGTGTAAAVLSTWLVPSPLDRGWLPPAITAVVTVPVMFATLRRATALADRLVDRVRPH